MCGKLSTVIISIIVLIISYLYYNNFHFEKSPLVTTKNGVIQGIVEVSRGGRKFNSYLAIPFAKPPIGELRFEPPQPADNWEGIKDASRYSSMCIQYDFMVMGFTMGSEDCLYLNVFVPQNTKQDKLKNVLFYTHGGYLHMGSSEVAGPKHFMDEDIILVTTNYRLGALGFLSTGDKVIRGNQGLKDQNLALRWVQDNIKEFGGNPSKVTIFGESAGGVSVHHHVLSPKSKGLFYKAIHQSGTALNYWAVTRNVKAQSVKFAKQFNCPVDTTKAMAACLKKLDASTLVGGHQELKDFIRPRTFAPSIEVVKDKDAFLVEEPIEILKSGRFNRVPLITGCNSHEGLLVSARLKVNQTKLNEANEDWDTWAPQMLHYSSDLKEVTAKLRKYYFGDKKTLINDTKYLENFTNLFGDRLFNMGASQSARLQSQFVPTYLYYYNYPGQFQLPIMLTSVEGNYYFFINFWLERVRSLYHKYVLNEELPHWGTSHGDEIRILFSGKLFEYYLVDFERDNEMSKDFVKLWADFAKDEKPLKFRNVAWPTVKNDSMKYLRISNDPAVIQDPFDDQFKFWESLKIPAY